MNTATADTMLGGSERDVVQGKLCVVRMVRVPRATMRDLAAQYTVRAATYCVAPGSDGIQRTTEVGWALLDVALALRPVVD